MLQVFDRVLASQGYDTLIFLTILAMFALVIMGVLDAVRSKVLIKVSHWLDNKLSPEAFVRSTETVVQGNPYTQQSMLDIAKLRDFLCGNDILAMVDAPWAIIYVFVIYLLHPLLGFIATIGVVLLLIVSVVNEIVTRRLSESSVKDNMSSQSFVTSTLKNAEAVQAMGMLDNILCKWFSKNEEVIEKKNIVSSRSVSLLSLAKILRMMLQISILGAGAFLVVANQFTPGAMIAASILTGRAMAPVVAVLSTWRRFITTKQAYQRLTVYLVEESANDRSPFLAEAKGRVTIERLYYQPKGLEQPIIKGINLEIQPGDSVVVMGPSGAGKSTLMRLLLGVWKATHGRVSMDGCDIAFCDRSEIGHYIGYCPQEVQLLPGTIKENIARMQDEDDEIVVEAAKLAGCHEMILELPKGYHTEISNYGLSGGQKQRVALARAFYGNPCFLVLDEPNANLDEQGSTALMQAIMDAKKRGVTVLMVTHQPNFINVLDKVMIMKDGIVQAFGPREQVFSGLEKFMQQQKQ
tara:strand:- start:7832 stop:9397 length:1566 start_codon:yes stop_codon:yes gene_type:complete